MSVRGSPRTAAAAQFVDQRREFREGGYPVVLGERGEEVVPVQDHRRYADGACSGAVDEVLVTYVDSLRGFDVCPAQR